MRKILFLLFILCCMMILGCNNEEQSKIQPDGAESTKSASLDGDMCKEILQSYLVQQIVFDNTKIRESNSHIVNIEDISEKAFNNFLSGDSSAQLSISDLMLDRTTDREVLRDYICHEFLIPTVALGSKNSNGYKKLFARSEGNEVADLYVELYNLTKFDIAKDDSVKDKDKYVDMFKNFINNVDPDEVFFFKVSTEHVDFNSINNQIAARVMNELIKDKTVILSNERIKNRKTEPPATLDEFWKLVPISSNAMMSGNDIQNIRNKTKQIFMDVLKDNKSNPPLIKDEYYVCMYGKPLLENAQKIFLVSAVSDIINKPSETPSPTGGVILSDKTTSVRPFIFTDLDKNIWKDFVGNISRTRENILFEKPQKFKPIGPSFSVLSIKPTNGSDTQRKYYRLNILLSNDTSKDINVNTSEFNLINSYDDNIGATDKEGSEAWKKKDKVGFVKEVGYVYKGDYDKFTDDELDMLTGQKSIPPQKKFEFTKIIYLQTDKLTSNEVWLTFRDYSNNYYWETRLDIK